MPHAADAGSAAGAAIEGFLGGVEAGTQFRRRRTGDQLAIDDRLREQIASKLTADRQAVLDQQNAAKADREAAKFQIETGLAPDTPAAAPTAAPGVPQDVVGLRQDVGRALDPGSVVRPGEAERIAAPPTDVPAGFRRVGPSAAGREQERVAALRGNVGRRLGIPEEDVEAFAEFDLLDDLMRSRAETGPAGFGVSVEGITGRAETPEEAIALRTQLTPEPSGEAEPKAVSDLRAEFARDPIVKDSAAIAQSFARMVSVIEQPSSGAGDLAIIFSFMKLLDPGSVVREGEFANAENSQGVPQRIRALNNRIIAGERLTDETRTDFVGTARNIVAGQREALGRVFTRFEGLAERGGIPIEDVTFDPFGEADGGADLAPDDAAFLDALLLVEPDITDDEMDAHLLAHRQRR